MQLVATPDTDCYFWFWHPLCLGKHYSISVSHMSVELVQFMSQLLNLVMFTQIFTRAKFAENKRSWQWEEVSFFAEFTSDNKHRALLTELCSFITKTFEDFTFSWHSLPQVAHSKIRMTRVELNVEGFENKKLGVSYVLRWHFTETKVHPTFLCE